MRAVTCQFISLSVVCQLVLMLFVLRQLIHILMKLGMNDVTSRGYKDTEQILNICIN